MAFESVDPKCSSSQHVSLPPLGLISGLGTKSIPKWPNGHVWEKMMVPFRVKYG